MSNFVFIMIARQNAKFFYMAFCILYSTQEEIEKTLGNWIYRWVV